MAESQLMTNQFDGIAQVLSEPQVFLEALTELNGEPTRFEVYQIRFLNDR